MPNGLMTGFQGKAGGKDWGWAGRDSRPGLANPTQAQNCLLDDRAYCYDRLPLPAPCPHVGQPERPSFAWQPNLVPVCLLQPHHRSCAQSFF